MDEDVLVAGRDASDATHRILQKSTGKEIGTASVYPKYLRCVDTMNAQLVHCDKLDVVKNPRSKEMFIGSNESSQLQQDLYLTDSEDEETDDDYDDAQDNKDLCDDVDEETKKQARLVEEMIVDESLNETSFEEYDPPGSSKSAAATSTNSTTNKLTMKSFYEEVDDQENVSDRKSQKVRCKLCKISGTDTLISRSNITTHIRNLHEQDRRKNCPHCNKNYAVSFLDSHIRNFHKGKGVSRVRCPHCDKELAKSSLRKHIKNVHRSEKDNTNLEEPLTKSSSKSNNRDLEDVGESATVSGSPNHDQESSNPQTLKEDVRKFHVKVCNDGVASPIRESPRRRKFKCDLCLKEFLLSRGLKSHQKRCPST